jgi:hypothetical protein
MKKYQKVENLKIKEFSQITKLINSQDYDLYRVASTALYFAETIKYLGLIDRKKDVAKLSRLKSKIVSNGRMYRYDQRYKYPFYDEQKKKQFITYIVSLGQAKEVVVA